MSSELPKGAFPSPPPRGFGLSLCFCKRRRHPSSFVLFPLNPISSSTYAQSSSILSSGAQLDLHSFHSRPSIDSSQQRGRSRQPVFDHPKSTSVDFTRIPFPSLASRRPLRAGCSHHPAPINHLSTPPSSPSSHQQPSILLSTTPPSPPSSPLYRTNIFPWPRLSSSTGSTHCFSTFSIPPNSHISRRDGYMSRQKCYHGTRRRCRRW